MNKENLYNKIGKEKKIRRKLRMHKIVKKIAALGCSALMAFGFASCELNIGGKTAYEIAVEQGFQGTELEWLQTLYGKDGKDGSDLDINDIYAAAVENGYDKDFLTFLKEYLALDITATPSTTCASKTMNWSWGTGRPGSC